MYQISAKGSKADIEAAWSHLAWTDPSPASAVDSKEDSRTVWRLDAYAETKEDADACVALVLEACPILDPSVAPVPEKDWIAVSLEGLPSVQAGRFIVAGSHALTQSAPGKTDILIEAGPAFGTGHHGTTLGCLLGYEYILRNHQPRKVLDVGTGSGVLAIAALKSGACRAIATDIDAQSVRVAFENARKNNVGNGFRAYAGKGTQIIPVQSAAPYDLVFANILARPLTRLAGQIETVTSPGGHIILSGLLNAQVPLVRAAYSGRNLSLVHRIRKDGWTSLVFRKPY